MLKPSMIKNDKKARIFIFSVSLIVFAAVVILSKVHLELNLPFNPHVFATGSSVINAQVAFFLIAGLITGKKRDHLRHKKVMQIAILLSVLFLLSYIAHHLLAGETKFGDINHDGILSDSEKAAVGSTRFIYYTILFTHIPLAAIILPFILFTAYRALIGEYEQHKKLTRITWPIWFYVAVSGVIVYWMIQPYYN